MPASNLAATWKYAFQAAFLISDRPSPIVFALPRSNRTNWRNTMKLLNIAAVTCTIVCSTLAGVAQAQSSNDNAPEKTQQVAEVAGSHQEGAASAAGRESVKQRSKTDECVGPVSFCNIYFGS